MLMPRFLLATASVLLATAVALAAIGAHAAPDVTHPGDLWWTAVFWQAVTGIGLFAIGAAWGRFHWGWGTLGAILLVIGVVLFSGTLYVRGVSGWGPGTRSEEHTSELQSLMRISYAVFCLKKKKKECHNPNILNARSNNQQEQTPHNNNEAHKQKTTH